MLNRKIVLISGATGFIGANLTRRCLREGAEVHILSRSSSNKWRLKSIKDVNAHCVDLLDYERLEAAVSKIRPQITFHTTVYGGYSFQKEVNRIIRSNIIGTANLLGACAKAEVSLFVNTGSSSEYGIKDNPMKETDLLNPQNIYGVSKACATLLAQAKINRLPTVTLRLFSPYGYYEHPSRLIPSVILACLKGENPQLSWPEAVRDFTFIEDVLDAYLAVVEKQAAIGEVLNIASGRQAQVKQVVEQILELTGASLKPEWGRLPRRADEPVMWQADISKARDILNWKPNYELRKGLDKTIQWFRVNLGLYQAGTKSKIYA